MNPRPHAELIKAWADGAIIEGRATPKEPWLELDKPTWNPNSEYRVKPQDVVERVLAIREIGLFRIKLADELGETPNLELSFDSETLKLKGAKLI